MLLQTLSFRNLLVLFCLSLSVFLFFQNCSPVQTQESGVTSTPLIQGQRKLGIHITQAQGESFLSTYNHVLADRFNHTNMHQIWGPGAFIPTSLPVTPFVTDAAGAAFNFSILDTANAFYPTSNMPVMLTIGTIDTGNKFVPSDFSSVDFDDPALRTAFKTMLTQMMAHLTNTRLVSLQIGNEVDIYLGTDASAWGKYKIFFDDVATHARSLRPGLLVSTTVTLNGAINPAQKVLVQNLMATADIVSVTYYPLNADFTMKSPTVVSSDIAALVSAYNSKPIYFQEIGFSSGSNLSSSEELQRQFVANFFIAWDTYADHIPVVSWLNYTEWSTTTVDGYGVLYNLCPGTLCSNFKEFLQTLGLRQNSVGFSKPALTEMRSQMQARSWIF